MFIFFKKYFVGFAVLALITAWMMRSPSSDVEMPSQDKLLVGLQSGYPPFEYRDGQGNIVGFDVDLAKLLADQLGKTLVVKDMEFEGEILSLKQGKIDLIISGMDITPSRLKEIWMIPYYGEAATSLNLIFWNKIPEGIHSLEDLANLPHPIVSVESGSTPEACLKHYPKIQAKSFQGSLDPLMDVKYGKSMANLVAPDVAEYLKKKHPEIQIIHVPLPKEEIVLGTGIGIKKNNHLLYDQVFEIIQQFKDSGELQRLEDKWFQGGQ